MWKWQRMSPGLRPCKVSMWGSAAHGTLLSPHSAWTSYLTCCSKMMHCCSVQAAFYPCNGHSFMREGDVLATQHNPTFSVFHMLFLCLHGSDAMLLTMFSRGQLLKLREWVVTGGVNYFIKPKFTVNAEWIGAEELSSHLHKGTVRRGHLPWKMHAELLPTLQERQTHQINCILMKLITYHMWQFLKVRKYHNMIWFRFSDIE